MLGRFSVAIDGQPVSLNGNGNSNGKTKKRPLALLKALVAFGGRGVAYSQLSESLWPDSDGDLGVRNLTVTLHRLRHLLRAHAAMLQHDGKLTLNERVCWVDVWNFERSVNDGLRRLNEPAGGDAAELHLRAALSLYSGHFLSRESEESWMLAQQLRLKTKFERLVAALSMHLENQDRFADAIDLCLHALERDPLNELLYRRLMSCYLKCGEFAAYCAPMRVVGKPWHTDSLRRHRRNQAHIPRDLAGVRRTERRTGRKTIAPVIWRFIRERNETFIPPEPCGLRIRSSAVTGKRGCDCESRQFCRSSCHARPGASGASHSRSAQEVRRATRRATRVCP